MTFFDAVEIMADVKIGNGAKHSDDDVLLAFRVLNVAAHALSMKPEPTRVEKLEAACVDLRNLLT